MIKFNFKYSYFILLFLFLQIGCKDSKKSLIGQKREINLQNTKENIDSIAFEKLKVSLLPIGNEQVVKYFNKITYNQNISYISDVESEKLNDLETDVVAYLNSNGIKMNIYKYPQKNNYDFGGRFIYELDSIQTSKDCYIFTNRLPNIGNNKIYLTHSNDSKEDFNDFSRNIDLVILNNQNKVINSLNLNYISNSTKIFSESETPEKHFYIDKDYIIHIKYFLGWGEGSISTLAYVKYKIQEDGSIIRYFDQKEGAYKSYIEEGAIKNNTKEGKWKEYLGGRDNMYAILNYKNGIVDGKIEIFDANDMPDMADPEQTLYPRYVLKLEGDKYVK